MAEKRLRSEKAASRAMPPDAALDRNGSLGQLPEVQLGLWEILIWGKALAESWNCANLCFSFSFAATLAHSPHF